ncbi:MAG TPA: hypothetical protein VNB49_12035, partial [Candidatus Dormibacteraeota bacterium]|nr:hypothetical protein [Candidatus Dormibacteraeota bacterium]
DRNPAAIANKRANGAANREKAGKRGVVEATTLIEVVSPVMVSPARTRVLRRVRLQVSRVPHARHTVVLFVQPDL